MPLLTLLSLLLILCVSAASLSRVQLGLGSLSCENVGTRSRQCLGVPFAAPPVQQLRWRKPQPVSGWSGVRDATKQQPKCLQGNAQPQKGKTSEDCLYLDIYAPRKFNSSSSYPVVVWLHGGSYETGA